MKDLLDILTSLPDKISNLELLALELAMENKESDEYLMSLIKEYEELQKSIRNDIFNLDPTKLDEGKYHMTFSNLNVKTKRYLVNVK